MDPIVNKFVNSIYYKKILQDNKVVFAFLGGSRLIDLEEENSDYDFTFYVDDINLTRIVGWEIMHLAYNGKNVHWYLNGFNFLKIDTLGYLCFFVKLININRDKLLYIDSRYMSLWSILEEHSEDIALYGATKFIQLLESEYQQEKEGKIQMPEWLKIEIKKSKYVIYWLAFKKKWINCLNIEQILYYKNKCNILTNEEDKYYEDIFQQIKILILKQGINVEEMEKKLYRIFVQEINNIHDRYHMN